jgi:hypothetical protein
MTKHHLLKNAADDFADSVDVEDVSWREFMDAGGVYPKEADPPTIPASLDEIAAVEALLDEADFNETVFPDIVVPDGFDDVRDRDL